MYKHVRVPTYIYHPYIEAYMYEVSRRVLQDHSNLTKILCFTGSKVKNMIDANAFVSVNVTHLAYVERKEKKRKKKEKKI